MLRRRKNSHRMRLNESHGLRTCKAKKYTRLIRESGDFGLAAKEGISNSEISEVAQNFLDACEIEYAEDGINHDPYVAIIFDPVTQTFSVMNEEDAQGDDIICLRSSDLVASIDSGEMLDDTAICDIIVDQIYDAIYNELGPDYDFSDPRNIPDDVETEEINAEIDNIEPDYEGGDIDIEEVATAPLAGSYDHLSMKNDDSMRLDDSVRLNESVRIRNRRKMLAESKDCEYFALKQARGVKKLW